MHHILKNGQQELDVGNTNSQLLTINQGHTCCKASGSAEVWDLECGMYDRKVGELGQRMKSRKIKVGFPQETH